MKVSELIQKAKWILDEQPPISQNILNNSAPLDEALKSFVNEAVKDVMLFCNPKFVKPTKLTGEPVKNQDGSGYITLPNDFLKLYAFKLVGWRKAVYSAIDAEDSISDMQKYLSTRGGRVNPVCVVDHKSGNVLRYYSLPPHLPHEIEEASYIALPNIKDDITCVQDAMLDVIAYKLASLYAKSVGDVDRATVIDQSMLLKYEMLK